MRAPPPLPPDPPLPSSTPAAPSPPPAAPAPARARTFAAFISYSHKADQALATALHGALHRFAKPWNKLRAVRIARDKATMDAASNLWGTIVRHIDDSAHFILLASTASARSPWVPREIEQFLRADGADRILIVLTEGEIAWDAAASDFDWARTTALPRMERPLFAAEPRYVDLRRVRQTGEWSNRNPEFREAVAEISATIRGISKDELVGQDVREHRRTRRLAGTGVAALALLAIGLGVAALVAVRKTQESTRRLAATYVANGARLVEDGDPAGALPWFAAAWRLEQGNEAPSRMHRLRFGATLARTARLERAWWAERPVWGASFSPDGRLALVTTGDAPDPSDPAFLRDDGSRDGTRPRDGTVVVWDVATGRPDGEPIRHGAAVSAAMFTPDGRGIITAGFDSTARLWDASTRRQLRAWRHPDMVQHAELSADGQRLLTLTVGTVSSDSGWHTVRQPVRVWPVWTDGPPQVADVPFSPYDARLSPDGRRVSLIRHGELAVWELETGRVRVLPVEGTGLVAQWSPDGRRLAVDAGSSVLLVDAAAGEVLGHITDMESPPWRIVFSPDGTRLLTTSESSAERGSPDAEARIWDAQDGSPLSDWHRCTHGYTDAAFAPDGLSAAVACGDGTVSVWRARVSEFRAEVVLHVGAPIRALAFSPRGERLLTLSDDQGVRLWDLSRRDLGPPQVIDGEIWSDFVADAAAPPGVFDTIIVPNAADTLVLHGDSGTAPRRIPHPGDLRRVSVAPGRQRVATAGSDDSVRVWDARTGAPVGTPWTHRGVGREYPVYMRFSPDGRSLATAVDHSVRVWDVERGRALTPLLWAPGVADEPSRGVAFTLGGTVLVVGTFEYGGRMWDARTGQLVSRLEPGWSVYLHPDSGAFAQGEDSRALPWRFDPYPGTVDEAAATAELLANARMDDLGGMVPLTPAEVRARWRARAASASRP
jgi:WD40 repeat protein